MSQEYQLMPGAEGSVDMYYSGNNQDHRCVGHIRGDFGKSGDEYWAAFWEHEGGHATGEDCKDELTAVVKALRKNLLRSRKAMRNYIQQHPPLILEARAIMSNGYQVIAEKCDYYIRCSPYPGAYDFYIYIYVREA